MRRDIHDRLLCAGKNADKSPCENLAAVEMTFDGISFCMRHGNKIIQREQETKEDLKRYREYQEVAFAAIVAPRPTEDLVERLDELARERRAHHSNLHGVRLDAETQAITRELARRRSVQP